MSDSPFISIIIPVYKVEEYLEKCVDSVLNQSYTNLEIFLVDDGSPDNCPAMCDSFAAKDSRVKVIHKANGGLSSARNAALDVCAGEYICFVDSDDYIAETAVEDMLSSLLKYNADFAVGNMLSFDESGEISPFYVPFTQECALYGSEAYVTFNQPCAPNRLYKAALFDDVRFPEGRLYEDAFIYHKIISKSVCVAFTGKTGYYYRLRQNSLMHSDYDIRFTDIIDAIKCSYEWLDSVGQIKLANEARMFVYSRTAVAFAHLDRKNPVHKKRLDEIKEIYNECYKVLIRSKSTGAKQKMRLRLLKYFPALHTKLFGKDMPIALG